jgi:drug/metabolite transporter (DMT)-like permease
MTGALFSFMASALAIRALAKQLNVFEILSIRSGLGLLILLALLAARPALWHELAIRHMGLHVARNTTHFVGQYLWALAVTLLPFATVFALEFTTPAWVALLAALFLRERLTISRAGSVVLGFLGVVVIVRPGLASFQPLTLLVLFAALTFALSLIVTKMLTGRVSTFTVIFWMNAMQLPMALSWPALTAATGGPSLFMFRLGADALLPTAMLGIVGLTSHYCLTNAFRAGDATVVVPMDFLRIPLIALVGWMFYGEALDAFVFGGAGLIICGVLWNLFAESRRTARFAATASEKTG